MTIQRTLRPMSALAPAAPEAGASRRAAAVSSVVPTLRPQPTAAPREPAPAAPIPLTRLRPSPSTEVALARAFLAEETPLERSVRVYCESFAWL
ncbi:MAG TPA: hypothetical protein RMH99_15335 [Sandaracinaceae bacterium LLY-WYZ-13_1]|nr:hypothetical protein [Sandaracinaceae bacterium LLY-WYZ-13_1]